MKHHSLHSVNQSVNTGQSKMQKQDLRNQIAIIAARFVAEDGATYANAKQKAAQQVLGFDKISQDLLPGNDLIEQQVHLYNQLFFADAQPARLLYLRKLALSIMQDLEQFNPYLTGAVLNGTAGEHSDIYIQLFTDNHKEVALYLLNKGIQYDALETQHGQNRPQSGQVEAQETLSFVRNNEVIHLVLYVRDDLRRISAKKMPRANINALNNLVDKN